MSAAIGTRAHFVTTAAAVVVAGAVRAQSEPPAPTADAQLALVEQVARARAEGGSTAAGAIDPLRALAFQYQEAGNDALAIGILEEARHVTRVNKGLTSADEAILLLQQIRSERALEAHQRVWDHEQEMVTMARQHHDDIRMAPIFRDLAEDRLDAFRQYRAGRLPPEVQLGCYYVGAPLPYEDTRGSRRTRPFDSCQSGNRLTVYRQLRTEILMYYADAIEVVLRNGDFASEELRDLERAAVRLWTFPAAKVNGPIEMGVPVETLNGCEEQPLDKLLALEFLRTCLQPVIRDNRSVAPNVGGWVGLVRLVAYEIRSDASATDRAEAIARLADWYLQVTPAERRRFDDGPAFELYERAYRELLHTGDESTAAARLFSPDLPIVLPTLFANPLATAESSRYIDVSFDITKYGRGEEIEVLDTSQGASRAEQRDLVRLIELSTFRPRFVAGALVDSAPVALRYFLRE